MGGRVLRGEGTGTRRVQSALGGDWTGLACCVPRMQGTDDRSRRLPALRGGLSGGAWGCVRRRPGRDRSGRSSGASGGNCWRRLRLYVSGLRSKRDGSP